MSVHLNSLLTYEAQIQKFTKREKLIYGHLCQKLNPVTDRQVKDELFGKMADMNMARPRISDLKRKGWVVEVRKEEDAVTGKPVRLVEALTAQERVDRDNQKLKQATMEGI